ncbi:MAG: L-serine ammonia-lyase, iron-sulfur-dependent, subunit alpha [Tissierellia bacterium]|nr:L-serine ammonia-lyase, iron-sulfur-dependent, subunit alpha [Tissierellia bacterium]
MFVSGKELLKICETQNISISEAAIMREHENYGTSRETIFDRNRIILEVMKKSAQKATREEVRSVSGIIGGDAKKLFDYAQKSDTLLDRKILELMAMGLSTSEVNASMGKIVAAPTAGAAGIIPAVLTSAQKQKAFSDEQLIHALMTSGAIGSIIMKNASVSGAVGGCQAETGSASAMAAAALVELMGGSPAQALDAASFALIHVLGLICDPVAGLVEFPCSFRNSSGAVNAYMSAELALAGVRSLVAFDEVVKAMKEVGDAMSPTLKETAMGGLAATVTGKAIEEKIFGSRKS